MQFIDYFFGETIAVEWFSTEAEDGLGLHIAGFGDGAAGRIAFGDKQGGGQAEIFGGFFGGIAEVDAAVAQFFVVQVGLFSPLVGQFLDIGDFLSFPFGLDDAFFGALS